MKLSKYTKLGILIVFCLTSLIWGLNFLKGIDFFKHNTTYYAVYNRIDGLLNSSAVIVNGYQVGQVTDVELMEDNSGRILVTFFVAGDFKLPQGSVARIISSDLMGTKAVRLELGQAHNYYSDKDTIAGAIESDLKEQVSMQVLPLKNKAEQLLASLDSAMLIVTSVFNKQAQKNLSESFEHINQTFINIEETSNTLKDMLRKTSPNISSSMNNIDSITGVLRKNTNNIDKIVKNVTSISDSLASVQTGKLFDQLGQTIAGLNQVMQKLQKTDNSAGLLLNDPKLYGNLTKLTESLDLLLKDFRNNPKRYVHFSAVDLGKNVYIASKQDNSPQEQITYKIHLFSSPAPVTTSNILFENLGKIEETKLGNTYNYTAGHSNNLDEIKVLFEKAKVNFPDAAIIAFKKGRKIELEKAIKKQSK